MHLNHIKSVESFSFLVSRHDKPAAIQQQGLRESTKLSRLGPSRDHVHSRYIVSNKHFESDLFQSQPQGCQRAALVVSRLPLRQRRRTSMRSLKREEGWSRGRGSGLPGQVDAFLLLCACSTEGVCRQAAILDISIHEMILSKAPVWGWRKVRRRRRVRATTTSTLPGPSSSDLTITPQTLYGLHPSRFNQGA